MCNSTWAKRLPRAIDFTHYISMALFFVVVFIAVVISNVVHGQSSHTSVPTMFSQKSNACHFNDRNTHHMCLGSTTFLVPARFMSPINT